MHSPIHCIIRSCICQPDGPSSRESERVASSTRHSYIYRIATTQPTAKRATERHRSKFRFPWRHIKVHSTTCVRHESFMNVIKVSEVIKFPFTAANETHRGIGPKSKLRNRHTTNERKTKTKKKRRNDRSVAQNTHRCIRQILTHTLTHAKIRLKTFGWMNCTNRKETAWERVKHNSMPLFRCINTIWGSTMKWHENRPKWTTNNEENAQC